MHLDIYEMTTTPQLAALHDKTIDIGLLREPPADETQLGFKTVLTEPFVAALPSAHPLTAQRAVQVGQLANSPFVLLPRQVGPRCDAHNPSPTAAFALSRLADPDTLHHTPIGVLRSVERPVYDTQMSDQLDTAVEQNGKGDLAALLAGNDTWTAVG